MCWHQGLKHENAPKIDKIMPPNSKFKYTAGRKNGFQLILWQTAGDVGQELFKTVSPLDSKSPPQFERHKNQLQMTSCRRDTAQRLQCNKSPCEQLAKTASAAGSRDNIIIMIVLLNGCDKIPNDFNI